MRRTFFPPALRAKSRSAIPGVVALLFSLAAVRAHAATVTTTADNAAGSLRQAISATPAGGTVDFNIPTTDSGYNASTGIFTITLTGPEIQIGRDLTIIGPTTAKIAISGGSSVRVFNVLAGTVNISNLTIRDGRAIGANGTNSVGNTPATPGGAADGGGIKNNGVLTLRNCSLIQNVAVGGAGGSGTAGTSFPGGAAAGAASGGGILNLQTLSLINCTLYGNAAVGGRGGNGTNAQDGAAGAVGNGGGVLNAGALTVINSTFNDNSAVGGNGGDADNIGFPGGGGEANGGGVLQSGASPSFVVQNTLIAGNKATSGAGGINTANVHPRGPSGTATGPDVFGNVTSQGHNLVGRSDGNSGWNGSDLLGGTTDGTRLDPLLGPLQDNGGPTFTMRPAAGSAAANAADDAVLNPPLSLTTDQRGFPRKVGAAVDIGAVELGVPQTGPSYTVTNTTARDDGSCATDDCSLVEALNATNANADANTITFAPGLSGRITNTIAAGLFITNPVTIIGPGARTLTVSGNDTARIFNVAKGISATISGLTLTRGRTTGNTFPANSGGAITNAGTLTLTECALSDNSAQGHGGAIYNNGGSGAATLNISNSTLSANAAEGSAGAIFSSANLGQTTINLTNCTLSQNAAAQFGGAIFNDSNASGNAALTLTNCTLDRNTAAVNASGIYNDALNPSSTGTATVTLRNTILRAAGAGSILVNDSNGGGTIVSQGSNISSDAAGGPAGTAPGGFLNAAGDVRNTDPKLGPLADNSGPTNTCALLGDSPAINAGNDANAPQRDQRSYFRSGVSDIGAFEFAGVPPTPPSVVTSGATNIGTTSATLNATANPRGIATTFQFTSDFRTFEVQNAGNGTADVPFSVNVTGLSPSTTYRFNAVVTSAAGTTQGVEQTFTTLPATRFANIATRMRVETGENVLIGGFIVTGSSQKRLLLRAIGPSLPLEDRLQNPLLELYNGSGELIGSNDNWQDAPNRQEIIDSTIPPSNDLESAILQNVNVGAHTAIVSGADGGTGVGLVEVYDLGSSQDAKLANISTRGRVQTGENVMIGGLIVSGTTSQKVIVRAIGPSLDVDGRLEDPLLGLFNGNGDPLASNDNWRDTQQAEIEATTIPPSNDFESAIVTSLPPAAYTAIVQGRDESSGVALVEVYALD